MNSGSSCRNILESNFASNGNLSEHPIGSDSVKVINNEGSMLHFIEGLSLRLYQMEFYYNSLDRFINRVHSDFKQSHEEQVSKLKSLEKLVLEVLISVKKIQKERPIPEQSMQTRSAVTIKKPPGFNLNQHEQYPHQPNRQPNNMNQSLSPHNRAQVYVELTARLIKMGYRLDHVGIAIKALEGKGQSIDINSVRDWLNGQSLYQGKE